MRVFSHVPAQPEEHLLVQVELHVSHMQLPGPADVHLAQDVAGLWIDVEAVCTGLLSFCCNCGSSGDGALSLHLELACANAELSASAGQPWD